jgi:hypothetical protein
MPAAIDVVELIGVKAEIAVGGEMRDKDDYRRSPKENDPLDAPPPLLFS